MKITVFCGVMPCNLVFANSPRYLLPSSSVHSESMVLLLIATFELVTAVTEDYRFLGYAAVCSGICHFFRGICYLFLQCREHSPLHCEISGCHGGEYGGSLFWDVTSSSPIDIYQHECTQGT